MSSVNSSHWSISPVFLVDDVVATANFYRDKLGFTYERFWGDPPCFCIVRRAGVYIMLSQFEKAQPMRPNRLADPNGSAWDAYLHVDDADQLYRDFQAAGVKIMSPICDQEYLKREFDIEDCNGYRLCFGHSISAP